MTSERIRPEPGCSTFLNSSSRRGRSPSCPDFNRVVISCAHIRHPFYADSRANAYCPTRTTSASASGSYALRKAVPPCRAARLAPHPARALNSCAKLRPPTSSIGDSVTAQNLQDLTDVRALIQLYVEGSNGDGDKMRQAFHPDAHMFGHIGAMDTYEPITDFTKLVEAQPGLVGPNYRADIRTIDLVGDAGVAVLVETDYFGCDFVDYFTVARIDGRWWITNKTYAHTGGTPPAS